MNLLDIISIIAVIGTISSSIILSSFILSNFDCENEGVKTEAIRGFAIFSLLLWCIVYIITLTMLSRIGGWFFTADIIIIMNIALCATIIDVPDEFSTNNEDPPIIKPVNDFSVVVLGINTFLLVGVIFFLYKGGRFSRIKDFGDFGGSFF